MTFPSVAISNFSRRNNQEKKKKKKININMKTKSFPVRSPRNSLASLTDERFGSGVEIVPDTFDERDLPLPHKKRHYTGTSENETGRGGSEPLNFNACIVCGVLDEFVSRCSGIDCLVSFHGECLNAELGGSEDLAANPDYCPYCWFKILALKSKSLREKAAEAEKAVFKYLDQKKDTTLSGDENGDQEDSVDGTDIVSDQELQEEKSVYSSKEKQLQVDMEEDKVIEDEVEASEEEERVATDVEDDDEIAEDRSKVNRGAGEKGNASPILSMQESSSGKEQENEKGGSRRRLILKATDSEVSSNESTEQTASSAQVTSKNQQRAAATKVAAKSKTVREISFFNKEQRRRLRWTTEEEEMLKVGVKKFAAEAKKNMPWRKILEMGENVFHETRTPADLKDKWRNMIKAIP